MIAAVTTAQIVFIMTPPVMATRSCMTGATPHAEPKDAPHVWREVDGYRGFLAARINDESPSVELLGMPEMGLPVTYDTPVAQLICSDSPASCGRATCDDSRSMTCSAT